LGTGIDIRDWGRVLIYVIGDVRDWGRDWGRGRGRDWGRVLIY
jgi:hypothetical protein